MKHMDDLDDVITEELGKILGVKSSTKKTTNESYVTAAKKFSLETEFLSEKTKTARQKEFEKSVESLNKVSAKLDTASRQDADRFSSEFRQLKLDESHLITSSFLKAYHFENISNLRSQIAMDTLTFMRLERDFGTFDDWQKDFIACGMCARSGFAVTAYNILLKRYINIVVDEQSHNIPISCIPVIVLDVSDGSYYRDYVDDRKSYIIAMMKELDWEKIDSRIKMTEKIVKLSTE